MLFPNFDPDSEAAYYLDQGLESFIRGEQEERGETCRYCKRGPFFWMQATNGWRLTTESGRVHRCKAYQRSA